MTYGDFWYLVLDDMRRHPALAIIGSLVALLLVIDIFKEWL